MESLKQWRIREGMMRQKGIRERTIGYWVLDIRYCYLWIGIIAWGGGILGIGRKDIQILGYWDIQF